MYLDLKSRPNRAKDSKVPFTREELEKIYEDATGLDARRGSSRIDILEAWIKEHKIEKFRLYDDPNKSHRDYQKGVRWYAGSQNGDTIMLGYTNKGQRCTNAVFAQSDEIYLGE
jgi:hypothetical protein